MSPLPRHAALAALALVALPLAACQPAAEPAPTPKFPSCVAFALDERIGIEGHEIDEASVYVERLEPAASPAHLRRLALTNIVLPRHVARLLAPEAHAKAKADAEALRGALAAGTYTGPVRADGSMGEVVEGGFSELGILPWGVALDLADGEWSEVIEEVGTFAVLRRVARTERASVIVVWFQAFSAAAALGALLLGPGLELAPTRVWPALIGAGLCSALGQLALSRAYQLEAAASVAGAGAVGPLFGLLLDLWLFDHLPGPLIWTGGALVIASGTLLAVRKA